MFENGLGSQVADLYAFWATCLEQNGEFELAQNVYRLGIKNKAKPENIINLAENDFRTGFDIQNVNDKKSFFNKKYLKWSAIDFDSLDSSRRNGILNENCIPYFNERTETPPPSMNQSIVQTIMDSARKAKQSRKTNLEATAHRLNFEEKGVDPIPLIGPNLYEKGICLPKLFVNKNKPQKIANVKHFVDPDMNVIKDNTLKIPQYNKLMLIPGTEISYSPEELRAYNWFTKRNISNSFTREMDGVWKNGHDAPFRRSKSLVTKNQPQDNIRFDYYDINEMTESKAFKFAISVNEMYAKYPNEEYSSDELKAQKWKNRQSDKPIDVKEPRSIFKMINQMKQSQQEARLKSLPKVEQENLNPKNVEEVAAPPRKVTVIEEFAIPTLPVKASRKSTIEFPELNETCTTQSFGMFLKTQGVSTPKSARPSMIAAKKISRLSHLTTNTELSPNASLLDFEKLEEEANATLNKDSPASDNNMPFQFEIYHDRTIDLRALEAKKAENENKPVTVAVQDENDENQMRICEMVDEKAKEETKDEHNSVESIDLPRSERKSSSMEYSIDMNSYERNIVLKNENKITNFTINVPANGDDGDEDDYEAEKSIYVPRAEIIFDEKKHADWAEVTQFLLDDCKENNYVHDEVDLNETRQVISTQLIDLMSLSPFDDKLKKGLLQSVCFEDKIATLDKTICTMQKVVQPLKPKTKLSIGERTFSIQKMIGSGAFGNVFMGICNKTKETFAFKQEKPPNLWEYYICLQIQKRVNDKRVVSKYFSN